jgi:hypothetical protein
MIPDMLQPAWLVSEGLGEILWRGEYVVLFELALVASSSDLVKKTLRFLQKVTHLQYLIVNLIQRPINSIIRLSGKLCKKSRDPV